MLPPSSQVGHADTPDEVRSFVFSTDCLPAIFLTRMLLAGRSNILLAGPTVGVGRCGEV